MEETSLKATYLTHNSIIDSDMVHAELHTYPPMKMEQTVFRNVGI